MFDSLKSTFRLLKQLFWIIGIMLVFFSLIELLRAYQVLHDFQPWLGYAYLIILFGLLIWILFKTIYLIVSQKKTPTPPKIQDMNLADKSQLQNQFQYLQKFLNYSYQNPSLEDEQIQMIKMNAAEINSYLSSDITTDALRNLNNKLVDECIHPILQTLKIKAEVIIRKSVRDIMIAIIASPYRSIDIYIVFIRNIKMFNEIMSLFNSRTSLRVVLKTFWDIMKIVATVNYINHGKKLFEELLSSLPIIAKSADDIAQGVGAGILTTSVGEMTVRRLSAYHHWDEEKEKIKFRELSRSYLKVVKSIIKEDITKGAFNKGKSFWNKYLWRKESLSEK